MGVVTTEETALLPRLSAGGAGPAKAGDGAGAADTFVAATDERGSKQTVDPDTLASYVSCCCICSPVCGT